jgi:hypothetical protein
MITYKNKNSIIQVFLDNKIVGSIKKNKDNLYQYFPKGSKSSGEPFKTIQEVKKSLEE